MRNDLKGKNLDLEEKPFVGAVKKFIERFSEIAKAANVGRAIGLVDSKDWVIEELQAEIAKLNKKKKSASD